jgi:hypothetical protein
MIVEPRVVAYINSLDSGNSNICNLIEKEALNVDDVLAKFNEISIECGN